jgi:tetratricopeptide (TPR) repeat protein
LDADRAPQLKADVMLLPEVLPKGNMKVYSGIFMFVFLASVADVTKARQSLQDGTSSQNPAVSALIKDAITREDAGDLIGAIEINQKILQVDSRNVAAMNTIAGLYGKLGKFEDEIIWAKKSLAVNPGFSLAYINYGNALGSLRKFNEAAEAFEKAVKLDPKDPLPVYSLGVLAEQQDKFGEALGYYQKAIQIDPKFENGYFNLAAAYANLRRFDEAIAALKKLLQLNPSGEDAKAMLQDIEMAKKRQ